MNPQELKAATLACALAGDVVRTFGEIRLRVFGTSMVPSILPGDLISVQRAVSAEISTGEIVLYEREGRIFAHRVVNCTASSELSFLVTRGDRLRHSDSPVSPGELLGRVISIQRGNSQWRPALRLTGGKRMIAHLLRNSDLATSLYLRLAARGARAARPVMPIQFFGSDERQRSAGGARCRA